MLRNRQMRKVTSFVLLFGAVFAVCTNFPVNSYAQSVMKIAHAWTLDTLDPAKMVLGGSEYSYSTLVFNGLVYFERDLSINPDLAVRWESNEDSTEWTFHLRKGVKFHHGRELDAEDVVTTFERIKNPETGSKLRVEFENVKIEAIDKYTVRFVLESPYAGFVGIFGNPTAKILARDTIDEITTNPIGTGPYKFMEYMPGDRLVLEKNDEFFDADLYQIDKVIFPIVPEYPSAVAALEAGDVYLVRNLPAEQIDELEGSATAYVDEIPALSWYCLAMNVKMAPFDDPKVVQAILSLIDKPLFTDIATFGRGTPTHSPIPPVHPWYNADIPISTADPAKAKKLLADAGYKDGIQLTLWLPGDTAYLQRLGVAFRDMAKKADVTVTLRPIPNDKFFADIEGQEPIWLSYFLGRPNPDQAVYAWYHSSGDWNMWKYENPKVDKLLERGRRLSSTEEQKQVYLEFQEIAVNAPVSVVFVAPYATGVHNSVKGFKSHPLQWFDLRNVYLEE